MFGKLFHRKDKTPPPPPQEPEEDGSPADTGQKATPEEFIAHCSAHAVKIGGEYGKTLDFTPESIQGVSEILDGYHQRYLHPVKDDIVRERVDVFSSIFGAYVGETLLRSHPDSGYAWVEKPRFGLVVAKGEGYHIDPMAKAAKQIVNGREEGDEVVSFFQVAEQLMEGTLDLSRREE